jgi:hypothetical protein
MMLGIQVLIVGLIFGIIGLILHFVFDCKFGEFCFLTTSCFSTGGILMIIVSFIIKLWS